MASPGGIPRRDLDSVVPDRFIDGSGRPRVSHESGIADREYFVERFVEDNYAVQDDGITWNRQPQSENRRSEYDHRERRAGSPPPHP
jgi:hypothetical protein